ncbi:uncharacterized protein B4U80_11444 [Leptotrombidium deliense]|uniref:Ubiquitin-like protease family profile domain-containing protein n=1 Tax=Leptotrombidium deliense TaxID=299467 RepID=A0A443S4B2_9ACAR|nr:uncharacterized protein B4U80_11444 [Leptotrombidium deliense]
MNTTQIDCFLKNESLFEGTYPCDAVPISLVAPFIIIINTAGKKHPGEHWVSLYVKENRKGIYFDSYGLPPLVPHISATILYYCKSCKYNAITLQTTDKMSFTCGHYCVLFSMYMNQKIPFKNFIYLFSKNTFLNDYIVSKIVNDNIIC